MPSSSRFCSSSVNRASNLEGRVRCQALLLIPSAAAKSQLQRADPPARGHQEVVSRMADKAVQCSTHPGAHPEAWISAQPQVSRG